jgi:hypothetical protein
MAAIGRAPAWAVVAEDLRDLQCRTPHPQRSARGIALRQAQPVERTDDRAQQVGGDMRVARRRVQLGVTQQNLDHTHISMVLHQMRREGVPQRVRAHPSA